MAQGKLHLNLIDKAHQNGYEVTLLYVAVNSVKTAIKRVNERVESGGYGIPPETIKKRYSQSYNNLPEVAFKSDNVLIYDNSKKFVNVYTRKHNQVEINNLKQYPWINQGVTFSKKVQTQLEKFADNNPKITGKLDRTIKKDNPKFQGYPFYIYQAYLN
ncbi:zeta toxin family protein [Levilactobacillus brevis]|uniref:zeta toxin family protein n=1 Tax=Lactobacillaceae TaxID=33958 RepID=UPI003C3D7212